MSSMPLTARNSHRPPLAAHPHPIPKVVRLIWKDWTLALIAFMIYLGASAYLVFDLHYYAGDALSRVANAYYVLFSKDPHLGAIGFVWNPLPSILELPIVAFHPWFPQVVTQGLAGSLVSAIFGTLAVHHLHKILKRMTIPRGWQIIFTLCFALNPLIVLYAANGMSDMMWIACILGTYSGVLAYLQTGSLRQLVSAGFWLAAGLGMRYEAVPFGAMLIGALILGQWGKTSPSQRQGSAILLGAPIVFAGGVWLYFNAIIMKNPLYFLDSSYSNLAQTSTGAYMTSAMAHADHHILGTLSYVARFGLLYWPIYLGFVITLMYCFGKRRDPQALVLVAGTIGAELLELVFAYEGHLGEWDRYFMEFIPNGVLLSAYAASKVFHRHTQWTRVRRTLAGIVLSAVFLSGSAATSTVLQISSLGHPDGSILNAAFHKQSLQYTGNNPFLGDRTLVHYVNAHPHLNILADTFIDWPIIVRARHLNQFTITSDYNFSSILHNPRGRVSAFLVPQPRGVAQLDAINRAWPGLWAGRVPWVRLIKSFPGGNNYRLYKILPTAP